LKSLFPDAANKPVNVDIDIDIDVDFNEVAID